MLPWVHIFQHSYENNSSGGVSEPSADCNTKDLASLQTSPHADTFFNVSLSLSGVVTLGCGFLAVINSLLPPIVDGIQ